MALPEGARAGPRPRLSSASLSPANVAHALVWLLRAGEMPPMVKKVEEMDVPGAPGTPAPTHAGRNPLTHPPRAPHELSPADRLVPMVTWCPHVPHLAAHAERPHAAVCVQHLRGSEPSESRETHAAARPPASETRPAGRPGLCRADRIRRRLGLRWSTLLAVVAHHDAAPMKRLGMISSSHIRMDAGGASVDSTPKSTAVAGLHLQHCNSEKGSSGAVSLPALLSSRARMSGEGRG